MLVTHLLVFLTDVTKCTSILILQTQQISSSTLLVIRVHHLMTLVSSTAHTFRYRWFVQLVRRHSVKDWFQDTLRSYCQSFCRRYHRWWWCLLQTQTLTTEKFKLRTSCNKSCDKQPELGGASSPPLFYSYK